MKLFRKREPTGEATNEHRTDHPSEQKAFQMVTTYGEHFYAWDGKLYKSDIVRACIRPKVKAIGKLVAKHVREDAKKGLVVNPEAYIRFLLREPNPYMTGQQFLEKLATQLCLNNNAFALLVRDENGKAIQAYPIPAVMVETKYRDDGELILKFQYRNGKSGTFKYSDIIHLKQDYNEDDIFGDSPASALAEMMEVINTIDQGIIKAIKNSGIIRWLLTFSNSMRDEDIQKNVKKFVDNYLSVESETFGAAGVDAKATATRIEPKDYVPNALQTEKTIDRIYSFFNTNKKIVQSNWTEDEWNAYFEAEIEPVAIQLGEVYSVRVFSRKERGYGNSIVFEASNLQCASLQTKLGFVSMVDRGAMLPNEWRAVFNLAPIPGGDQPIRRLDTQVVNMIESLIGKMDAVNYPVMAGLISDLLKGGEMVET